jgi:modulator of FtsH protease
MANQYNVATAPSTGLATNKLIRNTYMLLSMTLAFSAVTAFAAMALGVGQWAALGGFVGAIVLIWFVLPKTANSSAGLVTVFGITGLLGMSIGPLLSFYLSTPNGPQIVTTAFGGTAAIFLGLSGYALTTKRDFSFLGGFLVAGFIMVLFAALANMFLHIPALSLAISAVVIMVMSGFILYDTGRMVNGGETNYIHATVGLYLSIFNIFIHLLSLLHAFDD